MDPGPPSGRHQSKGDEPVDHGRLNPRDISLINISIAAAQNRTDELRAQMLAGVSNDLTPQEITNVLDEVVLHMEVGSRTTCASSLRCSATLTAIERLSPGTWNGVADSGQRPRRAGTPEAAQHFWQSLLLPLDLVGGLVLA